MKNLDPRLRRIVYTKDRAERVREDVARDVVTGTETDISPDVVTKRVLVELSSEKLPDDFSNLNWVQVVGRIFTVDVPLAQLEQLAARPEVEFVEAGRKWFPLLDSSLDATHATQVHNPIDGSNGLDGNNVIVGIIDFGLDFTLDDFRDANGDTRIAFLWDQFLTPQHPEQSPVGFNYGVEYDATDLNQALQSANPFAEVRHQPPPSAHGTHVAGITVGNGRSNDAQFPADQFVGAAPGATIIFVQPNTSDQSSSFTDSSNVADAAAYIFAKANELNMPCVINMSLGQNGGSHDAESIVERAIDRLLEPARRVFVSAAGNEHIWRGHASGALAAGATRTLSWKVGGGLPLPGGGQLPEQVDRTNNEMEIWYSSRDRFRVRVRDPDGNVTNWLAPGEPPILLNDIGSGTEVFIDSERFTVLNGDARIYIELSPKGFPQNVTNGVWDVEIEALDAPDGAFDAWIERDARDPDNRFADQSFFMGADFDAIRTLGTPATTRRALAVANYNHGTVAPSNSSSRGRTRDLRNKPELAAPGTGIVASNSLGGRPDPDGPAGSVLPMRVSKSGTSMAAPHVSGIAAMLFEANPNLSAAQMSGLLIATADMPAGVVPFDRAWGYGRVHAAQALALLRDPNQSGQGGGIA
ncbi:MAG: S8 family peptidase [Hyphomicrobiaceae bacterium]